MNRQERQKVPIWEFPKGDHFIKGEHIITVPEYEQDLTNWGSL